LLFLALAIGATGVPAPWPNATALAAIVIGALAQIAATGLMLAAMREKSFVVSTALIKTEPVHAALFGLVVLGDALTLGLATAIALALTGVYLMSWPKGISRDTLVSRRRSSQPPAALSGANFGDTRDTRFMSLLVWRRFGSSFRSKPQVVRNFRNATPGRRAIVFGLAAAVLFGVSAVGYRAGILALGSESFIVAASTALAIALTFQTVVLTAWLAVFDRPVLGQILASWRPSLAAGFTGAAASQFWFLAFAIAPVAQVRTLALIEILFAQVVSRRIFSQAVSRREIAGMALIAAGVAVLLNL
jgi:drug/metabolite transporter (DMT)-like permease